MKNINYLFIFLLLLLTNFSLCQSNFIPNGNFENVSNLTGTNTCSNAFFKNNNSAFDSRMSNWKVAKHTNSASSINYVGLVSIINYPICNPGFLFEQNANCGNFSPTNYFNNTGYQRFIRLRADYRNCKNNDSKIWHAAVAVSLDNNGTFDSGENYIIRYKINPIRAVNEDPTDPFHNNGPFCNKDGNKALFSHMRFFLSQKGFQHWNNNSSDKQELINVNFTKQLNPQIGSSLTTVCDWQQVERKFTPNQGNYTTLVIYAESGGAFIDDVEVFKECENYVYIQNKNYDVPFYSPNAIDGLYNFGEKAGINLYAGNNVDNSKTNGDVILAYGSKVNYTASNVISITDGFWVQPGADFTAKILPCPNGLNREAYNTNINPDPNYLVLPPLLSDEENEIMKANEKEENDNFISTKVFPNPTTNSFIYKAEINIQNATFKITNLLNQVVYTKNVVEETTEVNFDINELPQGVYFLSHYNNEGKLVSINKIVKS